MFSLTLLVVATSQLYAGKWPSGSVVWSNSSFGTAFETAQRLPNGNVIMVIPDWRNENWNLTCFSRVTGEATWTTVMPFSSDNVGNSEIRVTIAVAQTSSLTNQRVMFEPSNSPVAFIVYGFPPQQMLAVNTMTGEIIMTNKTIPLNTLACGNDAGFVLASGPQFYNHYQEGHMQVAAFTIPSSKVLANFTLFPFTPQAKCASLHHQQVCLTQSGCV